MRMNVDHKDKHNKKKKRERRSVMGRVRVVRVIKVRVAVRVARRTMKIRTKPISMIATMIRRLSGGTRRVCAEGG